MKVEPFDTQRQMTFTRRQTIATGSLLALFGGISWRLYDLQVRRFEEFAAKADDNRFKVRVVVPRRGEIVDRFGNTIATSRQNFRILMVPEQTKNVPESIARLERIVPLTDEQETALLKEVQEKRNQAFLPVQVLDNLTWEQYSAVNFHAPRLPGIATEVGETRYYPAGEAVAPFVGHVGAADRSDLNNAESDQERRLYRQPGFKLGKLGLERSEDEALRGQAGSKLVEISASGRVIEENTNRGDDSDPGSTLSLTIDVELQLKAQEILTTDYGEYPAGTEGPPKLGGSAVVMDIETGDVLVLASTPSFDPNLFATNIEASMLRELTSSPQKPMLCKPLAGAYPPGSTFKPVTAIAGLEAGIPAARRYRCNGRYWDGTRYFNCWQRRGHGAVDLEGSLKHSCDVYYYNVGAQVDIDHIADVGRRFGLGQTYDLGISGQVDGIVPSREWKRRYYRSTPENQQWFPGETLSVAIGQGAVSTTPLQLAVMTARIASGREVVPRIVRTRGQEMLAPPSFGGIGVEEEHLLHVREGLNQVVNEWGTGSRSSLKPDYMMAGKTGTAQVVGLQINPATGRPFQNHQLPWRQRDHALFIAFAPYDKPRYACAVIAEHGGSGSRAAGPRARDIMRAVLDKDPSNPAKHEFFAPDGVGPRLASSGGGAAGQ